MIPFLSTDAAPQAPPPARARAEQPDASGAPQFGVLLEQTFGEGGDVVSRVPEDALLKGEDVPEGEADLTLPKTKGDDVAVLPVAAPAMAGAEEAKARTEPGAERRLWTEVPGQHPSTRAKADTTSGSNGWQAGAATTQGRELSQNTSASPQVIGPNTGMIDPDGRGLMPETIGSDRRPGLVDDKVIASGTSKSVSAAAAMTSNDRVHGLPAALDPLRHPAGKAGAGPQETRAAKSATEAPPRLGVAEAEAPRVNTPQQHTPPPGSATLVEAFQNKGFDHDKGARPLDPMIGLSAGGAERVLAQQHAALQGSAGHAPPPDMARNAAAQMAVAITQGAGRPTEIALYPEELGRVRMALTAVENSVSLTVFADRPETVDLLRRHIDVLAQEFRALGYVDIQFQFGGGGGTEHDTENGGSAGPATPDPAPQAEPSDVAHPSKLSVPAGRVDLRL